MVEGEETTKIAWTHSATKTVTGYRIRWRTADDKAEEVMVPKEENDDETNEQFYTFDTETMKENVLYKVNIYAVANLANPETGEEQEMLSKELHEKVIVNEIGDLKIYTEDMLAMLPEGTPRQESQRTTTQ